MTDLDKTLSSPLLQLTRIYKNIHQDDGGATRGFAGPYLRARAMFDVKHIYISKVQPGYQP
jgi:hypothetical protein